MTLTDKRFVRIERSKRGEIVSPSYYYEEAIKAFIKEINDETFNMDALGSLTHKNIRKLLREKAGPELTK